MRPGLQSDPLLNLSQSLHEDRALSVLLESRSACLHADVNGSAHPCLLAPHLLPEREQGDEGVALQVDPGVGFVGGIMPRGDADLLGAQPSASMKTFACSSTVTRTSES